jgi:hypothetical protein
LVAAIPRIPWVARVARVPRVADVPKVAEVFVHHLVLVELSDVLTAEAMHMGSLELADGRPVEQVNVSTSKETDSLARRGIDVISHEQTLDVAWDIAGDTQRRSVSSKQCTYLVPVS